MLQVGSTLKGYAIEASDGKIGSVSDFLFDEKSWKIRWLIVDTGHWLSERRVLIHPSAIGKVDDQREVLPVGLTRAQIEGSPEISRDQPLSVQTDGYLYDYYHWDPLWGDDYFRASNAIAQAISPPSPFVSSASAAPSPDAEGAPYLRSVDVLTDVHIAASDGEIGHVAGLLVDDCRWDVRYLIIDTRNWLPERQVLMSPYAVRHIDWEEELVHLDVTREQVEASPPWNLAEMTGRTFEQRREAYERKLHLHYGWPGYGWF